MSGEPQWKIELRNRKNAESSSNEFPSPPASSNTRRSWKSNEPSHNPAPSSPSWRNEARGSTNNNKPTPAWKKPKETPAPVSSAAPTPSSGTPAWRMNNGVAAANNDKPTPAWKKPKETPAAVSSAVSSAATTPSSGTPPWRMNNGVAAANNDKPTPPWKAKETPAPVSSATPSSGTPPWRMNNGVSGGVPANNDKPIPPWKAKVSSTPSPVVSTTPSSGTPPWKANNGDLGALSLADKLKQRMSERKQQDPQPGWSAQPPPPTEQRQPPVTPMKPQRMAQNVFPTQELSLAFNNDYPPPPGNDDFPLPPPPPPTEDFPPPPVEDFSSLPPPPSSFMSPPSPRPHRAPVIPPTNKKPSYIRPKMAIPNRRPLPADLDSRPPPDKPGKPAVIRGKTLMYQSRKLPLPPPADGPSLPNRSNPRASLPSPLGPPLPGGKPPGMVPPLPGGKPPGMVPPLPGGKPPGMIPPLPAKPQHMTVPPIPVKTPAFAPPQRNLQFHINRASTKSTISSNQGSIYDDTCGGDMIETWDDEDETESFYDDTADLPPPPIPDASQRASIGTNSSFYTDTAVPHLPAPKHSFPPARQSVIEAPPDDTYEEFGGEGPADDTYETFEPCAARGPPSPVVTDKKKEKEMRKKFKLPKEGEIEVQSKATMKSNAKGGGKDLQVTCGEVVDVIKLNDCPKKKWLIRNSLGVYGYVESSNVQIDAALLQLNASRYSAKRPASTCSSDKIQEEIYDETPVPPPEDLYEEL